MTGRRELGLASIFAGRELLLTGVTGFLGKVALALLLDRYPEIGRVHVLIRPRGGSSAADRFFGKVAAAPPFDPLRARHGPSFETFLREKCNPLAGDVADRHFGLDEAALASLEGRLSCVVNCAGLVSFNPSLETAISVNVDGARNGAELCERTSARLVHISTCFVAGEREGPVFEDEPVLGSFPKSGRELGEAGFSLAGELADCARIIAAIRAQGGDGALEAQFVAAAAARLAEEGRDARDEKAFRLAVGRERKLWVSTRLVEAGMARARQWGWPNTYTYTKALGEQAVAQSRCEWTLVRPSIVESALRFPFPGWNEGFTTTAPLQFMALKGQRASPAGEKSILDLIPVDLVCAGIVGIAGAACAGAAERVYQLASGDVNPLPVRRAAELGGLFKRRYFQRRAGEGEGARLHNLLAARLETFPVSKETYRALSTPMLRRVARGAREALDRLGPRWGAPRTSALAERAGESLARTETRLELAEQTWEIFLPFVAGRRFIFQCRHTRALWEQLSPRDRERLPWDPERLDWHTYWLDVHAAGLEKWVFPGLEDDEEKALRREVQPPRDLLALLAASAHAHGPRAALRLRDERTTYAELARFSERAAARLAAEGVLPGERVALVCESRPEWAMAFFGALQAGAAVMPVDPALPAAEIARQVAEARLAVAAPSDCERLQAAGLRVLSLVELLRPVPSLPRRSVAPDQAAVLLDGAVMTHRKLAALAARLASLFALRTGERVLSMRPLHDVCELAGGLLAPLFAGAQVSYGVEPDGFGGRVLLPEAEIPEQVALALRDGIS